MINEIDEIILEWDVCAAEIETAIQERNYGKFRKTFIKGKKCFNKIKALVEKGEACKLKEAKEKVEKAVSDWRKVSERIPEWLSEMKTELRKRKEAANRDKKLSGAYKKYTKSTGTKLKIKAR